MNDLDRLRHEYADRQRRFAGSDLYSPFNAGALFTQQQRQRDVLRILRRYGFYPLDGKHLLEVGCGNGGVLLEYLSFGASPTRLYGVDLLRDRLQEAHGRLPHLPLACADGQSLPYPAQCFDLLLQYTAFSSILDDGVKANLGREMLRVLKPNGLILWYDFWLNPTNPQTRGIRPAEIRKLFPGCRYEFHRITLAPPVARRIAPRAWGLALFLESLKVLNTHYLTAICLQ
jgi:ubiquinone/menaquinone biosynthesis C-methylase UbiE